MSNSSLEKEELAEVMKNSFAKFEYCDFSWMAEYDRNEHDIKLMFNDKIVGFHLFSDNSIIYKGNDNIKWYENLDCYKNKRGIEGIILGVLPEYTKKGGGTLMVEYETKIISKKYDYMWGGAYKDLNNLSFWLQSRRLIGESSNSYQTIVDFT